MPGKARMDFLGISVLGLTREDGSEIVFLGSGGRVLAGGGARVKSLAAALLTVSITDDS